MPQIRPIIAVKGAEQHVILHSKSSIAHFALSLFLPYHLSLFEFYNFDVLLKLIGSALLMLDGSRLFFFIWLMIILRETTECYFMLAFKTVLFTKSPKSVPKLI